MNNAEREKRIKMKTTKEKRVDHGPALAKVLAFPAGTRSAASMELSKLISSDEEQQMTGTALIGMSFKLIRKLANVR